MYTVALGGVDRLIGTDAGSATPEAQQQELASGYQSSDFLLLADGDNLHVRGDMYVMFVEVQAKTQKHLYCHLVDRNSKKKPAGTPCCCDAKKRTVPTMGVQSNTH